jgi:hypothetical protein
MLSSSLHVEAKGQGPDEGLWVGTAHSSAFCGVAGVTIEFNYDRRAPFGARSSIKGIYL